jgi:hypothetical protein
MGVEASDRKRKRKWMDAWMHGWVGVKEYLHRHMDGIVITS